MSSVVISGDTSGAITLAAPAVSGTNTATLPAATGTVMVSGNMPTFSAYKSGSDQTLSNSTFTKITFTSETFDTNNNFASSTFTPTVAGYYQITAQLQCFSTLGTNTLISLYKNGSEYSRGVQLNLSSGNISLFNPSITNIVYCNGSTDYIEIYGYITATSGQIVAAGNATYFSGVLARTA
jgi:hypothetical protein